MLVFGATAKAVAAVEGVEEEEGGNSTEAIGVGLAAAPASSSAPAGLVCWLAWFASASAGRSSGEIGIEARAGTIILSAPSFARCGGDGGAAAGGCRGDSVVAQTPCSLVAALVRSGSGGVAVDRVVPITSIALSGDCPVSRRVRRALGSIACDALRGGCGESASGICGERGGSTARDRSAGLRDSVDDADSEGEASPSRSPRGRGGRPALCDSRRTSPPVSDEEFATVAETGEQRMLTRRLWTAGSSPAGALVLPRIEGSVTHLCAAPPSAPPSRRDAE